MSNKDFYRAFEEKHRGSRELIKSRVKIYLPFVLPLKDIYTNFHALDIGCGRGEWLELLKENYIPAHGIDFDEGMLTACHQLGLNVFQGDGIKYLKEQESESKIVISAFHVVEHISFEDLQLFVEESLRVLKPGGLLIMETPNPENIKVATENFYLDPTHIKPIPSSLLSFLPEFYGFARTKVIRLQESQDLLKQETVNILQVIEGVSPDYAVIAQKDASLEVLSQFNDTFLKEYGLSLNSITDKFENRLLNLEAKASEAEAKASEAEAKASEAEIRTNDALHQYHTVINSNSWKIMKPFRILGKLIRWFYYGIYHWITFSPTSRPRRILNQFLMFSKQYINERPVIKNNLMKILNLFPKLRSKLKLIAPITIYKGQNKRKELTSQAQMIFDEMKQLFQIELIVSNHTKNKLKQDFIGKCKMAIVTPFPPDRTGIADYVIELLPALMEIYDVDIVTQNNDREYHLCPIQTIEFFKENSDIYDIIIYQIGNSPYHAYMFELLYHIPGIVVLHDFYLGNIIHWMQYNYNDAKSTWDSMLLNDYGYSAPFQKSKNGILWAIDQFPVNAQIFQNAKGVIVHSLYAKDLSTQWYGNVYKDKIFILPQVHKPIDDIKFKDKYSENEGFLVCSFGHIIETKLIEKIISSWILSKIGCDVNNRLLLVGSLGNDEYGKKISKLIEKTKNIQITGFLDDIKYQQLLGKANLAIQLRSNSRGETSRAVLDCMAYGIPTIVNSNGSMTELPDDSVIKIADKFTDEELVFALDSVYTNLEISVMLSANAKKTILNNHLPQYIAGKMQDIINQAYSLPSEPTIKEICYNYLIDNKSLNDDQISNLAKQFELNSRNSQTQSLYIDISAVVVLDLKTGIQRVVRSILFALLERRIYNYKIIPVYLTEQGGYWHYRVAHTFMHSYMDELLNVFDTVVEPSSSDIFIGLDYYADAVTEAIKSNLFGIWKERGVLIYFVIYDILPIEFPDFFPSSSYSVHLRWLIAVSQVSDSLLCISNSVAKSVENFFSQSADTNQIKLPKIEYFHLGADIENSLPSKGLPENAKSILNQLSNMLTFMSVGTIEPRKGQDLILLSFEKLWDKEININLVLVGKQGWMVDSLIKRIQNHQELNKRLFWLDGISDEYLEKIYESSDCLIAASKGEGFGLPLIEAAQKKLSIIARDIPVFREVAGEFAYYFENNNDPETLVESIEKWITLYKNNKHPKSDDMPWLTWKKSTEFFLNLITKDQK